MFELDDPIRHSVLFKDQNKKTPRALFFDDSGSFELLEYLNPTNMDKKNSQISSLWQFFVFSKHNFNPLIFNLGIRNNFKSITKNLRSQMRKIQWRISFSPSFQPIETNYFHCRIFTHQNSWNSFRAMKLCTIRNMLKILGTYSEELLRKVI